MIKSFDSRGMRKRRHRRIRMRLFGTAERPRLSVFRSAMHIYAQIINDDASRTLVAASSLEPGLREKLGGSGSNIEAAKLVGELISKRAQEKGISQVVFDRGGNLYHGRIAALADAAREAGLNF